MAVAPSHWLIGVRESELDAGATPRFLRQLLIKARPGEDQTKTLVRRVTVPESVRELSDRHGKSYAAFYYVDEQLLRTCQKAGILLHPLELVFGPVEHAEIYAAVALPIKNMKGR